MLNAGALTVLFVVLCACGDDDSPDSGVDGSQLDSSVDGSRGDSGEDSSTEDSSTEDGSTEDANADPDTGNDTGNDADSMTDQSVDMTGDLAVPVDTTPDACMSGTMMCSTGCADLTSDPLHCGMCERACDPGARCVDSDCVVTRSFQAPDTLPTMGSFGIPSIGKDLAAAINDRGDRVVATIVDSAMTRRVVIHRYDASSAMWSSTVVQDNAEDGEFISVAISSTGHVAASWLHQNTSDNQKRISVATFDSSTSTWSPLYTAPNAVVAITTDFEVGVDDAGNVVLASNDTNNSTSWSFYNNSTSTWTNGTFTASGFVILNTEVHLHMWPDGRAWVFVIESRRIRMYQRSATTDWVPSEIPVRIAFNRLTNFATNRAGQAAIFAEADSTDFVAVWVDAGGTMTSSDITGFAAPSADTSYLDENGNLWLHAITDNDDFSSTRHCEPSIDNFSVPWGMKTATQHPSFAFDLGDNHWQPLRLTVGAACIPLDQFHVAIEDSGLRHYLLANNSRQVGLGASQEIRSIGVISAQGSAPGVANTVTQMSGPHSGTLVRHAVAFSPSGNAIIAWVDQELMSRVYVP